MPLEKSVGNFYTSNKDWRYTKKQGHAHVAKEDKPTETYDFNTNIEHLQARLEQLEKTKGIGLLTHPSTVSIFHGFNT